MESIEYMRKEHGFCRNSCSLDFFLRIGSLRVFPTKEPSRRALILSCPLQVIGQGCPYHQYFLIQIWYQPTINLSAGIYDR
jgi:hypothetical protein